MITQGLAERHGECVVLARNLLATLRTRELDAAAKTISSDTGLHYRPATDGATVSGLYKGSTTLVSGRFAMLENGLGFTLVPWRPVIEPHLGRSVSAVVQGDSVSWMVGRQRGLAR